jgi:hypothetical protein
MQFTKFCFVIWQNGNVSVLKIEKFDCLNEIDLFSTTTLRNWYWFQHNKYLSIQTKIRNKQLSPELVVAMKCSIYTNHSITKTKLLILQFKCEHLHPVICLTYFFIFKAMTLCQLKKSSHDDLNKYLDRCKTVYRTEFNLAKTF